MEFVREEHAGNGVIRAFEAGQEIGEITYQHSGEGRMMIDYTGVSTSHRNRGIGKKLVDEAIAFAREQGLKIIPFCSFARIVMERDPSVADVLVRN